MSRTMGWRRLGRIYLPGGELDGMVSHAAVPCAWHLTGDRYRIFFSSRDRQNRSHVCWLDLDLNRPQQILDLSPGPVLSPGDPGGFDDSGAMATWAVAGPEGLRLYYIGWNLGVTVPFRNAIGLAVSGDDGRSFTRFCPGPILDRTMDEPHFTASCCVLSDGDRWRIWYLSCLRWTFENARPKHWYHIKQADSDDGVHWERTGAPAIDFIHPGEYAISRPSVLLSREGYEMWYSWRGERYRVGYAVSADGRSWQRRDEIGGLEPALSGWDAGMVEYPCVFEHSGERFMLYNGNEYGRSGFGLAVWEGPKGPSRLGRNQQGAVWR